MLARLEDEKLVTSEWETPTEDGQRPRKYYRLTGDGIRVARLDLAALTPGRDSTLGRTRLAPGTTA